MSEFPKPSGDCITDRKRQNKIAAQPPPPTITVSENKEAERLFISISKILHGGHDEPSMLIIAEIVKFRQLAINSATEKITKRENEWHSIADRNIAKANTLEQQNEKLTKENEELRAILRNKDTTFREALESVIILEARIKELETALKTHGITQVDYE